MKSGKDLTILGVIINNFLEQGKTTITEEEIEEQYNIMLETQKIYNLKKDEIKLMIERLIAVNKIQVQDIYYIKREYEHIIEDKKSSPYAKNIKLLKIEEHLNNYTEEMKKINLEIQKIFDQIKTLEKSKITKGIKSMYDAEYHLDVLRNELIKSIYKSTINEIKIYLNSIPEKIDEISSTVNKMYNLRKYQYWSYSENQVRQFKFDEIIITIDLKNKFYGIQYESSFLDKLEKYKINKLKKLLQEKLNIEKLHEIIEPKYVNELTLSRFVNKKILSIKELMKFNPNGLFKYLELDKELNDLSIEELTQDSKEFKEAKDIIEILKTEGFEPQNSISLEEFFIEISQNYRDINLDAEKTYETIGKTILEIYPDEDYIYSSMQNAYNCVDRNLIKDMHQDLSNNNLSNNVNKVIAFIKKYSRNPKGESYTEKEILNFLKQKNEIVNTKYSLDNQRSMQNLEFHTEVNEIMRQLTGIRDNYSQNNQEDTIYIQDEEPSIKDIKSSKRGRKK